MNKTPKTGLGAVLDETFAALHQAKPQQLDAIIDRHHKRFVQDLARAHNMLGMLLVCAHDDMDDLVELGWLQIALSEMTLSWQRFALPPAGQQNTDGD